MTTAQRDSLVWKLAGLLRESGDVVLSGCSTLSLLTPTLQQLNHVFELHLGPWGPGQTGFVALPSHPADSPVILQLQFLFDVLQKTLSLKLVHVPGPGPPGPIKIFPFKSLRHLEELLSACGGDFCSALPWLALLSANFSYNALTALDSSLHLLSALRFLNLSHNQVQDCQGFLMDLCELHHLDISYNRLHLVPRMGPSGAALGILILRGNELRSLHGLEQLRNLRHLDLAYNLLEGHRELSPLWLLTELRKFLLDGKVLLLTDSQTHTSLGLSPMGPPLPWPVGSTPETSGGPDLSDSLSSGGVLAQAPLHKVKSRVRVRRASISEPSDTDPEPRTLKPSPAGWFVQQHRELELMSSFRERFGRNWLQYRSHLEASGNPLPATPTSPAPSTPLASSQGPDTTPRPPPLQEEARGPRESPQKMSEEVRAEPQEEEEEKEREEEEKEGEMVEQGEEEAGEEEEEEQDQKEVEGEPSVGWGELGPAAVGMFVRGGAWWVEGQCGGGRRVGTFPPCRASLGLSTAELCRPMLVCPLEGPEGMRGRECFLRVTSAHLFEVELQAARTLERLELQSLEAAEIEPEAQAQRSPGPTGSDLLPGAPVLSLRFSYICPDRQLRRYLVLEPDAHAAVQELLAVLTPVTNVAREQLGEARDLLLGRFQCLRCGHEFKPEEPRLGLDSEEGWRPLFQKTESPAVCPNCGSDHVVLLTVSGGTPNREQKQGEQSLAPSPSASPVCHPPGHGDHHDRAKNSPPQALSTRDHSSWSLSPPPERCGLRSVDHRLRLFLDVEVLSEAQEEFQCCLKVPVALAGHTGEFMCLVVVSDHRCVKVTGGDEVDGNEGGE
uniref:Serine/threonine-protein kinase 11-interacting protein n=1 Tax=Macaca fascicularis TaxID=9541 RepID=A0A7N9CU27_MACFA